jgi:AcrR family transcriptional regulator
MAKGAKYTKGRPVARDPVKSGRPEGRRRELIQIAGRLFAERGFLATTIRDVADAAGIQSGSLYHHFSSKESMADELLREYWSTLLGRYRAVTSTDASASEQARQLILESVRLLESCELAVRMSTNDWGYLAQVFPFMQASLDECEQIWTHTLEQGVKSGAFSDEVDPAITYRTIMAAIGGTARWFRPGGRLGIDELADDIATIFIQGIATRA